MGRLEQYLPQYQYLYWFIPDLDHKIRAQQENKLWISNEGFQKIFWKVINVVNI